MIKCRKCNAENEITDGVCYKCGAELPAPYEIADELYDGFDDDDIMNPVQNSTLCNASLQGGAITILAGAEIHMLGEVIQEGSIVVVGDVIAAIYDHKLEPESNGTAYIDCANTIIVPGFIDSHTHGMHGIDVNKASAEKFRDLSILAAKYGITTLVPTTVACLPYELEEVINNLKTAIERGLLGAKLIGLHLESNFINPKTKGAQPEVAIFLHGSDKGFAIKTLLDSNKELIKIVTLAPEMEGNIDLIGWLLERDIKVSIGHSDATYEEATAGIDAGATRVTHLFNAMSALHHRKPNVVGTAMSDERVMAEIVGDGVHVHPAVMKAAINAKGVDSMLVISDSLPCAYLPDGQEMEFAGHIIHVEGGVARMPDGNIAGSITSQDKILKLLVEKVGLELNEAVYMTSTAHAVSLDLNDTGQIAEGMKADLAILDHDLNVRATIIEGKLIYSATEN